MKTKYCACICYLIFGLTCDICAQNGNWREYVMQLNEEEQVNPVDIDNMYEELLYLENNPMNLNEVSQEQLERFPLLSSDEVTSIIQFLKVNRPLMTVYELRNVPYLNYNTVRLIIPFFYVGDIEKDKTEVPDIKKIKNSVKYGRHEVQLRFDKTLTPRAGYGEFTDSILERYPNRKYQGENFYTSLRYSLKYNDKIEAGITAEKDAGEPFLKPYYTKGYDHYGVHLIIRDVGKLRTLALGDYRLSFGQGLILNNDFSGSKSWGIDNIAKRTLSPKRHFSTAESNFFRGGAAVFDFGNLSLTAFYSNKKIDANLSDEGHITSFKVDGLHRTKSEIEKKKNSREEVTGANINFRKNRFQAGISGLYHKYSRIFNPSMRDYNAYYLRGTENFNASIDYSYQLPGFIFAGETAVAKNGAVATLNSVQYRPNTEASFTLLHRHYPVTYNALHAQAFSEGSRIQNENGLFMGAAFKPFKRFMVNTYLDFARFPWKKYGVDGPSKATDFYFRGTYTLSPLSYLEARYKFKMKEKNLDHPGQENKSVLPYTTNKIRLRYNHEYESGWNLRSTVDFARYNASYQPDEKGIMISQNIGYRGERRIKGDAYLAWFNTDTYNARLYSYERNLLSTFYMPSFYGKGIRLALSAKFEITSHLTFSAKAGYTNYFNRDVIGSGTEQINGNSRTDIFTYLRWRL
ncbi:MAG: helix-hairpin-helix domain-containing protein [Fermentimonas sp.]|nr:helix-hairpin-helix domain-containing protein [Fermentimonas sp.]